MATMGEYRWFTERATEMERRDPVLRELKNHLRAATAAVGRADTDEDMAFALMAENEAIQALLEHVASKHKA